MPEIGRFALREELGGGPYYTTYKGATDGQQCAVKVLTDQALPADAEQRQALGRALAGLTALEHPSAVRVLGGGEAGGKLYVASEFMECPTLEQKLQQQSPLPEQQVVLYIRQTAQALDKARDLGYCHGDLRAANVFVVSAEKVKVCDFAVKSLIEDPPQPTEFQPAGEEEEDEFAPDEWVTAEDLLRSKGKKASKRGLEDDFVGLAVLTMRMLGVDVPPRGDGGDLDSYRDELMRTCYPRVSSPEAGVSVHTSDVVRRLLSKGGFDSPGEVVVELASAMLLGRTFGRPKPPQTPAETPTEAAPATETAYVHQALEESDFEAPAAPEAPVAPEAPLAPEAPAAEAAAPAEPGPPALEDLGDLEFDLDVEAEQAPTPEPVEAAPAAPTSGAAAEGQEVTTFFVWNDDRRSGRFFLLYEGERLTVGRDPDVCDITLMDPAVSRQHCFLSKEGGAVQVEDAGSSNGTFVNEGRVQSAELNPGDRLRIGTTRVYTSLPGLQQ
jgi:hypothetical protein